MKKIYTLIPIFALTILSLVASATPAFSTVGGPTYVSQLGYNASNKSVYYIETSESGRGCPPIIHEISFATNQDKQLKSCDELEGMGLNQSKFITETYKNLTSLGSVNLKKNNVDVKVKVLSEHIEVGMKFWTDFQATVTQDGKEVSKLDFRGCSKDQANLFEGYRVPNTDAMVILISRKGDCFEGGYVRESLHLVKGVKYYDTSVIRTIKDSEVTEPNAGTLTVYAASDSAISSGLDDEGNSPVSVAFAVVILVIGLVAGFTLGRKSPNATTPANPKK